ncbi:hypothetical protein BGZ68_005162 [Mortierella alpina]|nr:hypothetical protein BGZ68_005162 [Mortierella alpina]
MTLVETLLCRPCVFCEIVEGRIPGKIIYKAGHLTGPCSAMERKPDNNIVAFDDINPSSETHILIVPVAHVESVKTLAPTTEHQGLLEMMRLKAIDLLKERGHDPEDTNTRLGFHVPPFNTVGHLHLHVLGGEFKSRFRKMKYEPKRMWYMDLAQLQADLEKKRRVQEGARL